jgi:ParB family chromosome partitioning protein
MAKANGKREPPEQKVVVTESKGAQEIWRGVLAEQVQKVLEKHRLEARVADIIVGVRVRKDMGDLDYLAERIRARGLLQPVPVRKEGKRWHLVAGQRRLEAVKLLGWETVPIYLVTGLDDAVAALEAERDENTCRKDFTPSEAAALGKKLEALAQREAKKRQQEGGRAGGKGSGKLPEASKGDTRDKVAEAVGMSGRTYEKVKQVVAAAEADPSLQPVVEEMDRTRNVDRAHRKVKEAEAAKDGGVPRTKAVSPEPDPANNPEDQKVRGKGIDLAQKAIDCLSRIPKDDALRKRAWELVRQWLDRNE